MERYACGQNQTAIARNENLNRESVARIVKSAEMEAFTEQMRERFRGLCHEAIESVRRLIAKDDKQTVFRVLESNGIIPPQGQIQNLNLQTAAKPSQDDRGSLMFVRLFSLLTVPGTQSCLLRWVKRSTG